VPNPSPYNAKEILAVVENGDESAFRKLFEKYSDELCRLGR
jgi:hypothetical protein